MKVGFFLNGLDNRGTGNAVFDYAHHNEKLLKNESKIFSYRHGIHNEIAKNRFEDRFGPTTLIDDPRDISGIDVLYHIKSGEDDGFRVDPSIRYAVHAVFIVKPHGDRYAAVSRWLADEDIPYVPHIIDPVWSSENYREKLNIPEDHLVIGRHGGYETFDLDFVWKAISDTLEHTETVHFVFMNTEPVFEEPRIHYLDEGGPLEKRMFINTCNAMLHARERGETFGIAVGEFAILGKPIMTYSLSPERAHIQELLDKGLYYKDGQEIGIHIYKLLSGQVKEDRFAYLQYSPNGVMKRFKEVFLD